MLTISTKLKRFVREDHPLKVHQLLQRLQLGKLLLAPLESHHLLPLPRLFLWPSSKNSKRFLSNFNKRRHLRSQKNPHLTLNSSLILHQFLPWNCKEFCELVVFCACDFPNFFSFFFRDIVKLTAQFVARNGRQFLTNLMNREARNYQFDFLRPQHSLFQYFTRLLEQYTKVCVTFYSFLGGCGN